MAPAQAAATRRPVATEPVKVIASTCFEFEDCLTDDRTSPHDEVEHALRDSGARNDLGERMRAAGNEVGRFEHHRVAVGERGRDLPGRDRDRKIPGRYDSDDPHRFARRLDVDVRSDGSELFAKNPQRFAGEEVEDLTRAGDFADRLGQSLALLTSEQPAEFLTSRENLGRNPKQDVVPFLRRRARPGRKCGAGRFDCGVGLDCVRLGELADDVIGVGGVDVASDAGTRNPFSGYEVLVQCAHSGFLVSAPRSCPPLTFKSTAVSPGCASAHGFRMSNARSRGKGACD